MLQTVAIRTPKHLCIKDNALVIREKKSSEVIGKIALSDIWVIIIDNPQVTMTSALMSGINKAGIGVLYCGSDHMPNGLALPLGAHSRHAEIVEHQLAISKPLRNQIWKRIITKKIENQVETLKLCFGDSAEVKKIRGYAQEVQSNDKTNRESIAASEYFKTLLPYGTRWNGPMTAPLNYGYAILRSGIAQCAVSHGWLVSRGIHHHSAENAFNLVRHHLDVDHIAVVTFPVTGSRLLQKILGNRLIAVFIQNLTVFRQGLFNLTGVVIGSALAVINVSAPAGKSV